MSKLGIQVPLDDDASQIHMVAAADATADSTMYREYVINQIQPITAWGRCYLTLDPHPLPLLRTK